jgi:GH43 family beta-xylosidase
MLQRLCVFLPFAPLHPSSSCSSPTSDAYSDFSHLFSHPGAPELHYVDGKWHIYYTAGTAGTFDNQRTHVLLGGSKPEDPFTYQGRIVMTGRDTWAIDSTGLSFCSFSLPDARLDSVAAKPSADIFFS